jgi:hypothetical protein
MVERNFQKLLGQVGWNSPFQIGVRNIYNSHFDSSIAIVIHKKT